LNRDFAPKASVPYIFLSKVETFWAFNFQIASWFKKKKKLAFLNCANLLIFCTKQNIYRIRTSYIFIFGRSLFYLYIWFIFSFEMISELDFFLFQFSLIRNANCLPLIMRCVYISWFLQFFFRKKIQAFVRKKKWSIFFL
jgi:hypothetical protein